MFYALDPRGATPRCLAAVLLILLALFGPRFAVFDSEAVSLGGPSMSLELKSSAFSDHGEIPAKYTCQGDDVSPPLAWNGVPQNAKSLVLIVDDPDAPDPDAPKMTWVHWVLYNLPPSTESLAENITAEDLPAGTRQALNDWKRSGYGGPCPPIGRHRYFHKLYALNIRLPDLGARAGKAEVEESMQGHIIAEAGLVGTYLKNDK